MDKGFESVSSLIEQDDDFQRFIDPERLEYLQMRSEMLTDLHNRFASTRKSAKAQQTVEERERNKTVDCPYCLDAKFVYVRMEHIMMGEIPHGYEVTHRDTFPHEENCAVPCDCHHGTNNIYDHNGQITGQKELPMFYHLFHQQLRTHTFGRKLISLRRKNSGEKSGMHVNDMQINELGEGCYE